MSSLKFRGRMAAVIVAILLITTIVFAVPVSASESCDHEYTTDYLYLDNEDGETHKLYIYCSLCSSEVVLDLAESHDISGDTCIFCGYIMPACQHTNTSEPVHTPDNLGGRWTHCTYYECLDCGEVFNLEGQDCYTTGDIKYTAHSDSLTHYQTYVCDDCENIVVVDNHEACTDNSNTGSCDKCGRVFSCSHDTEFVTYKYFPNSDGKTHTISYYCLDCGSDIIVDENAVHSDALNTGNCEKCGYALPCTHSKAKTRYIDNGDGTHKCESVCERCEYVIKIDTLKMPCEYVEGFCKYCGAKNKSLPTIPEGAIPAYVFKDFNGRWTVATDEYFGGINYLDLFKGTEPYIHSKSTVSVVSMTSNEIILKDHDGGVMANNNRVVGINFGDLNLQDGVTYYFDAKVESPYLYPRIFLTLRYPDGKVTYLKTGNEFVYVDGLRLQLDLKTNESFSKSHGSPYEVRFYDLMISEKGHTTFEPYGVRYFNNTIAYDDFVAARLDINKLLAEYTAGFDYFESIVNGSNVSAYKDNLLKLLSKIEPFITSYRSLYSNYYVEHSNSSTEFSKMLNQLVKGGSFEYNKGYTDGYGSAVKDFDNVSDGGFAEGIINGGFKSLSDSWGIVSSGVSISGISVGNIVSTFVILLFAFFVGKIILR